MPTIKEYIKWLEESYNPEEVVAVHLWSEVDVLDKAEEMKMKVSKKKAKEIIEDIHRHIDCEYGITWTTIQCALEDVK